jgi:hypothetical protein
MSMSNVQRMMSRNKQYIRGLHEEISFVKEQKKAYDAAGFLDNEYEAHNYLNVLKKEMKAIVQDQKFCKALLKEI